MTFGAVAVAGALSATTMQLVRGPLTTAMNANRQSAAETAMMNNAHLVMTLSAKAANDGDCDGDQLVEPLAWRDPGGTPSPGDVSGSDGGGLLPGTSGARGNDPWGTEYGYCVWDHGARVDDAACGGASQRRLPGTASGAHVAMAIISAGPDQTFQTACKSFANADANDNGQLDSGEQLLARPDGSDDMVYARTYE